MLYNQVFAKAPNPNYIWSTWVSEKKYAEYSSISFSYILGERNAAGNRHFRAVGKSGIRKKN